MSDYGKVKIEGEGDVGILDFVQTTHLDGRIITTMLLEDDSYGITIQNPPGSGREPHSSLRLSYDSFMALMINTFVYIGCKDIDIEKYIIDNIGDKIDYSVSDNMKQFALSNDENLSNDADV